MKGVKIVDSAENTGNVSCILAGSGDVWYILFVSFISDYRQTFQDVQAFAKISDDHRKINIDKHEQMFYPKLKSRTFVP